MDSVSAISGSNAMEIALAGIDRGLAGIARDAQTVAQSIMPAGTAVNLASVMVDVVQRQLAIAAAAGVLVSTSHTLGTLIDVTA